MGRPLTFADWPACEGRRVRIQGYDSHRQARTGVIVDANRKQVTIRPFGHAAKNVEHYPWDRVRDWKAANTSDISDTAGTRVPAATPSSEPKPMPIADPPHPTIRKPDFRPTMVLEETASERAERNRAQDVRHLRAALSESAPDAATLGSQISAAIAEVQSAKALLKEAESRLKNLRETAAAMLRQIDEAIAG